jgi:hypothetical protein
MDTAMFSVQDVERIAVWRRPCAGSACAGSETPNPVRE